jgi:hypothetical protein
MPASKVHDQKGEENEGKPFPSTRLTVNLVPKAVSTLKEQQLSSGDNKTDVINRAIQVYGILMKELQKEGTQLLIKRGDEVTELIII